MEMLLTGDAVSAEDAYRMGWSTVVHPGRERAEALPSREDRGKSSHIVKSARRFLPAGGNELASPTGTSPKSWSRI
jgi:enoyl-CoA hydratase/carnithine racemase